MYCAKCNINWSVLREEQGNGDTVVECCPSCLNDMHLSPTINGDTFHMDIKGRIVNNRTKIITRKLKPVIAPKTTPFDIEQYKADKQAEEDLETAALEAYHKTGNEQDYFTTLNKR